RADEGDLASVRRPERAARPFGQRGHLVGVARARHVEYEDLVDRPAPADEGNATAVGRPFRRGVAPRPRGGVDRLGLEQTPDDDPAAILARLAVGPAQLVGDALPVPAEPDVVDP